MIRPAMNSIKRIYPREFTMTHWKRYLAALFALSVPALAGCGHSQDTAAPAASTAASPAPSQAAQAQAAEQSAQQGAAARAAAAHASAPGGAPQNAPK